MVGTVVLDVASNLLMGSLPVELFGLSSVEVVAAASGSVLYFR